MKLSDVLNEQYLLIEYDQGKTLQALGPGLIAAAKKDRTLHGHLPNDDQQIAQYVLKQLEQADPTPHKEYTQWLARTYAREGGRTWLEDFISKGADALDKHLWAKKRKKLGPEYADINRIKTLNDLLTATSQINTEGDTAPEKPKGNSEQVYEDGQVRIIKPLDKESAIYYGQGTKWCTAASKNNMYAYYAKAGSLFIIIPKNGKGMKYQFHFGTSQFMDPEDKAVGLNEFWSMYPGVKKFFQQYDESKEHRTMNVERSTTRLPEAKAAAVAMIKQADYGLHAGVAYAILYSDKTGFRVPGDPEVENGEVLLNTFKQELVSHGTALMNAATTAGMFKSVDWAEKLAKGIEAMGHDWGEDDAVWDDPTISQFYTLSGAILTEAVQSTRAKLAAKGFSTEGMSGDQNMFRLTRYTCGHIMEKVAGTLFGEIKMASLDYQLVGDDEDEDEDDDE